MCLEQWICCQVGAREYYAVPRAFHRDRRLAVLVTDAWIPPGSPLRLLPGRRLSGFKERFHPDLADAPVRALNAGLLRFELTQRMALRPDFILARNEWFQRRALKHLKRVACRQGRSTVLFSYSYAARHLFAYAKQNGWRTVLGQIDPGPAEEAIVAMEQARHPDLAPYWHTMPTNYWAHWRSECALADRIVVNSPWSQRLLEQAGAETGKIRVVPLVYDPPPAASGFNRTYPRCFSANRPMRVLFLGTVTLRKGVAAILEAIKLLDDRPIEFWMVGPREINVPDDLQSHRRIRWIDRVPRSETPAYYQTADLFLFPTLSDGFGLTQWEAQAWRLPMLVSEHCGPIVCDQVNGIILREVNAAEIAQHLCRLFDQPRLLQVFADSAVAPASSRVANLTAALKSLFVGGSAPRPEDS